MPTIYRLDLPEGQAEALFEQVLLVIDQLSRTLAAAPGSEEGVDNPSDAKEVEDYLTDFSAIRDKLHHLLDDSGEHPAPQSILLHGVEFMTAHPVYDDHIG